jgi:hypothetical protein
MNAQAAEPEITIRRVDGSWSIVSGSHVAPLPWKASASFDTVARWIRTKMGGPVHIIADLS